MLETLFAGRERPRYRQQTPNPPLSMVQDRLRLPAIGRLLFESLTVYKGS